MRKYLIIIGLFLTVVCSGQLPGVVNSQSVVAAPAGPDLLTGLEAYWKLDEASGNAADATGNGNTGTSTNIGYGTDGKILDSYTFNGTNAEVNFNAYSIASGTTFSFSFWVYRNTNGAYSPLIFNTDASAGLYIMADGTLNMYYGGDHNSSSTVSNTTWTHVMVVVASGTGTFYINNSAAGTFSSYTTKTYAYLGGVGGERFTGGMDEVAVYIGVALDTDQRAALYNSGNGKSFDDF